jgi:hypothetical protein
MSLWKRLFGSQSATTIPSGKAGDKPSSSRPSPQPQHSAEQQRDDTSGFFVFDYSAMDCYYGKQAFDAIYNALRPSTGVCAFYDGDIFNCESVRELGRQANLVVPASPNSPLANLGGPFDFGAYFAAMWTDKYPNFRKVHNGLMVGHIPGYLGYMTIRGRHQFEDAAQLFYRQLHLPQCIALKDGEIVKGTSKYGIGFRSADGALLRASELGDLEAARKAIADGADVNCVDPNDRVATPIVHAACEGHWEIVKLLLEKNADPNARNMGSNTALMLAARRGHIEVVKALIAAGVEVNAKDHSGGTALDNAKEHPEIMRILRQAGASG